MARQFSRSFLYGDIRLAIHIKPASAKSFATSPELNKKIYVLLLLNVYQLVL